MARLLRQPRTLAVAIWLAAFIASATTAGYPTRRMSVLIWIILAVVALGIDRPRAALRSFATTWLPLFVALHAYDRLRGASDGSSQSDAHSWPHMDLDVWLGGGTTPSRHLQDLMWTPGDPRWWDFVGWTVYQSHFVVPLLVAVAMWGLRHRFAMRYVISLATVSWLALATYWLYPAQPPWMVARDGLIDDLDRIVPQVWKEVGIERAARVFTTSQHNTSRYANPVAALPSLHAALPMLIAAMLWGTRRWLDVLLAVYALAMGFVLVYAGEHFTFDIVLGWAYALAVAFVARSTYQRRSSIELPTMPELQDPEVGSTGKAAVEEPAVLSR